jgi:hypothetical protein
LIRPKNLASRDGHLDHLRKVQSRCGRFVAGSARGNSNRPRSAASLDQSCVDVEQHALSAFDRHLVVLFSKPNDPAIPQQPESRISQSRPNRDSSFSSTIAMRRYPAVQHYEPRESSPATPQESPLHHACYSLGHKITNEGGDSAGTVRVSKSDFATSMGFDEHKGRGIHKKLVCNQSASRARSSRTLALRRK